MPVEGGGAFRNDQYVDVGEPWKAHVTDAVDCDAAWRRKGDVRLQRFLVSFARNRNREIDDVQAIASRRFKKRPALPVKPSSIRGDKRRTFSFGDMRDATLKRSRG